MAMTIGIISVLLMLATACGAVVAVFAPSKVWLPEKLPKSRKSAFAFYAKATAALFIASLIAVAVGSDKAKPQQDAAALMQAQVLAQPAIAPVEVIETKQEAKTNDDLWGEDHVELNQAYFEKSYADMKDMRNKPVRRNHSADVESYVSPCYVKEKEQNCQIDHANFGAAYRYAFRGNYQAQRNVAFLLSHGSEGINTNKIQGCAWRIVILSSGDSHVDDVDASSHKSECGSLSQVQHNAARARATELVEEIYGTRYIPAEF